MKAASRPLVGSGGGVVLKKGLLAANFLDWPKTPAY